MKTEPFLVFSCEHAVNSVPSGYRNLFTGPENKALLDSHRGWDKGILPVFRSFAGNFDCARICSRVTRLLFDQNRSPENPELFPSFSRNLTSRQKDALLRRYYFPYIGKLKKLVADRIGQGPVLHLSFHSFTPVFDGNVREADFGILFDPGRGKERDYAISLMRSCGSLSGLTVRYNEPYAGTDDGICTLLRREFSGNYAGLEFEFSQKGIYPVISDAYSMLIGTVMSWLAGLAPAAAEQYFSRKRRKKWQIHRKS